MSETTGSSLAAAYGLENQEKVKSNENLGRKSSQNAIDISSHEGDYYLSGLFNIETSPGFRALDNLKNRRDIPEERVTKLKNEFTKIHSFLLSLNLKEKGMGEYLRNTLQEITTQKLEQDRAISQQFSGNAEIGELKRELLKAQNEVDSAMARETKLQTDIEELSKTKQDLVHDIEEIRRHKADMLEPQLIASTKELKIDLIQRRHQVENLQKDMEEKQASLELVSAERDRNEAEREKHAIAFVKASETPIKIIKQIEVLRDAISSLSAENSKQMQICLSLDKEIERLSKKKKDLEEQRIGQSAAYEERRGLISQMERQVDDIFKDHELAKEQLAFQKAERIRLDLSFKRTQQDIKREHDLVLRVIREKDSYLKLYRRLELTVNNIKMSTPTTIKQGEDLKRQLKSIKNDEIYFRKEMNKLRQIIDVNTLDFLKQEKVEKTELEVWHAQMEINKGLEQELDRVTALYNDSIRSTEEVGMDRDIKAREVIRSRARIRAIKNDHATKEIAIMDSSKRATETQNRVKEFMTLYELVKNERNKYLNQIHSSSQRASEMKEKIKILSNEIEILRHELSNKDRELAKKKQESSAAYALRDSLRNEANKLMLQYREKRDQIDHRLTRIEALNSTINSAESDMLQLKSKYEQSIKDRNAAGVQLLDRNDELCILYERINVQKEITDKGAKALQQREEECRKLELIMAELKRKVELEKQKKPQLQDTFEVVARLESERTRLFDIITQLGQEMENPDDPKRCRNLGGADLSGDQMAKKIEKMEALLALQEVRRDPFTP
ncbi:hypothetical protein HDU91_002289, partial [Kappamyces sp. JEL0680]